jgi:hypothetical protein
MLVRLSLVGANGKQVELKTLEFSFKMVNNRPELHK